MLGNRLTAKEDYVKHYLAIATALLALGAMAVGCGGTEALSAKEYFNKLEAIANETQEKESTAQPSEEDSASLTPDQVKEQGIEFLDSSATINEDALQKVEDLDPPDDLQEAHDRLVAAGRGRRLLQLAGIRRVDVRRFRRCLFRPSGPRRRQEYRRGPQL